MKKLPVFTLGVEEEYQNIDPETRDLRSHLSKIIDGAKITIESLQACPAISLSGRRGAPACAPSLHSTIHV